MNLIRLHAKGFRNLIDVTVNCGEGINLFFGENAQGKTNLLEAIHLISTLHSFRTQRASEMITLGGDEGRVEAGLSDEWGETDLAIHWNRQKRSVRVDGKSPGSAAEYLTIFPTVFFGPTDMELAHGSQFLRRRYIDRAAFVSNPGHLDRLRRYRRALHQRNAALKRGSRALDAWNEEVAREGCEVHRGRKETLQRLTGEIIRVHDLISGGREKVEVSLRSGFGEDESWEPVLDRLREEEKEDRERGFTLRGPHRDRVSLKLNGANVSTLASQGQKRTLALSLKLALLTWSCDNGEETPAFLLDDPGSELDKNRLGFLGDFLSSWKGQVFIATVGPDDVPMSGTEKPILHQVSNGQVAGGLVAEG